MSEGGSTVRTIIVTFFPMFIATLSLLTSIYNGYLNNKFVDIIENNIGRVEALRTCKEIIDAYFQVKLRTRLVAAAREPGAVPPAGVDVDAANAVSRFAALGTYLANLRDDAARARYTELTRLLERAVVDARRTPAAEVDTLFTDADVIFAEMNSDCVKSAKE